MNRKPTDDQCIVRLGGRNRHLIVSCVVLIAAATSFVLAEPLTIHWNGVALAALAGLFSLWLLVVKSASEFGRRVFRQPPVLVSTFLLTVASVAILYFAWSAYGLWFIIRDD